MEQHPIPQNVTTFQFRLIGDMTIKQFGYLAVGAILAYVSFKLPLPFFFTWPMTIFFAMGGFGLAFVPVEDRPMDVWVLSFFRNIYNPTLFVWEKSKLTMPPSSPMSVPQKVVSPAPPVKPIPHHGKSWTEMLLSGLKHTTQDAHPQPNIITGNTIRQHKDNPFSWFMKLFTSPPRPPKKLAGYSPGALFSATPMTSVTGTRIDPKTQQAPVAPVVQTQNTPTQEQIDAEKALKTKIDKLESELKTKEASDGRVLELQKQLMAALSQSAKNEAELAKLRQQTQVCPAPQVFRPAGVVQPMASAASPTVRVVPQESATKIGLPHLTTIPNLITGVVKDDANNLLPTVLITVRDKDDVPLRALKSNKLGQFAASTPLSDGTYIIEVEDPRSRYAFDRVQITLQGNILPAIEIIAKNQKRLDREKLAAQVFGGVNG